MWNHFEQFWYTKLNDVVDVLVEVAANEFGSCNGATESADFAGFAAVVG